MTAPRQLDLPAEGSGLGGVELKIQQCRTRLIRCRGRRKSHCHQPFAPSQKCVEVLNKVARIDDAEQLDVVGGEHDAIIAGALPDMAAARRQCEAETAPAGAGTFEIPHPDDGMIDPRYGVAHPPLLPSGADPPPAVGRRSALPGSRDKTRLRSETRASD